MLLIKKIETATDLNFAERENSNAEENIWTLVNGTDKGSLFFEPMVPLAPEDLDKTLFFFKKSSETIWKGGYYISPNSFQLTFDGIINHQDSSKPLMTAIGVKVLGLNTNQNVSEIITWLDFQNQLTTDEVNRRLISRKKEFFERLEQSLYSSSLPGEVQSSKNANEQIAELANECMLKIFPWFDVKITFANTEVILSESEKEFKKNCEEMAERQRNLNLELQKKQADMSYRLSLHEMEQTEKDALAAANLREQDRLLALEQKDLALKITKETTDAEVKKAIAKVDAERQEIWNALKHKEELRKRELKEREEKLNAELHNREQEAKKADANLEILSYQKELEALKVQEMKEKIEFNRKYRAEKLKSLEKETVFDQSFFNNLQAAMAQNQSERQKEEDSLRNKMTAAYGNMQTRKTEIARRISIQKRYKSLGLKRDGVFPARAISLVSIDINAIKIGTKISFKFACPVSGYFTLFCAESSGNFSLLAPNAYDQHIRVEAGRVYEFPAKTSQLYGQVTQDGPSGFESVYAVITPTPLTAVPPALDENVRRLTPAEVDQVAATLENLPSDAWAADEISYHITE